MADHNLSGYPSLGAGQCPEMDLLYRMSGPALSRTAAAEVSIDDPELASNHLLTVFSPNRLRLLHSPSDFRMRLRLGRIGAITLSSLSFNAEVELAQQAHQRFVLVTTQFKGSSEIATRKQQGGGGPGLVVVDSANSMVVKRFSADSERLNVRIDERAMAAMCASLIGRSLDRPLEFHPLIHVGETAQRRWLSLMRVLLDYAVIPPAAGFADRLLAQLEEMAMLMLLTEHRHSYSDLLERSASSIAPRHVRAAEEFIRANAAEALTLAGIAAAAAVGIRTLTSGFQAYRQTTPMKYLREVRLSLARQDLLDGTPDTTVSDIALRWGFGNFGRFAAEYHRRFGEYPSDTLRGRG